MPQEYRPEVQTEQMLREWAEVFIQHNELFRGSSARPGQFSLIARRAVDRVSGTLDDHADRPPLTEAVLKLLIETATQCMERNLAEGLTEDGD